MESMTNGPHLLGGARAGYRLGNGELVDSTMHDALFCAFDELGMGAATETYTKMKNISGQEQDNFAAMSHGRAAEAQKNGLFEDEIVPVPVPQRRATRSWSPRTRASARRPPPSRWPSCARPSPRPGCTWPTS
jgi:acetyl-CoA C-acetyltransferase